MVKRDKVKSLAQLRQRKQELQLESEITKREMAHSLGIVRTDLQSYLLKRVALPVGGSAIALYLFKKFVLDGRSAKGAGSAAEVTRAHAAAAAKRSSVDIAKIIKIAIPIIQAGMGFMAGYFKKDEEVED